MGNFGSSVLTFLLSVPLTAIAFMAIFGVPQVSPLVAAPNSEIVVRDPFQDAWSSQPNQGHPSQYDQSSQTSAPQWGQPQQSPQQTQPGSNNYQQNQNFGASPGSNLGQPAPPSANAAPAWPPQQEYQAPQPSPRRNPFEGLQMNTPQDNTSFPGANAQPAGPGTLSGAPSTPHAPNVIEKSDLLQHPGNTPTGIQLLSWEQAQKRLTELGISKYQITNGSEPGKFLVVCLFNPPTTPQVTHRFDAEGENPQATITELITKIEQWIADDYAAHAYASSATRR